MEILIKFYLLNLLFHYLFDNTDIILFDFCVDYVDDEWKTVGIQGMLFIQFYFCCRNDYLYTLLSNEFGCLEGIFPPFYNFCGINSGI